MSGTVKNVLIMLCIMGVTLCLPSYAAETIKCKPSRDVWLSAANSKEVEFNMGAAPKIKMKVWQEFGIVDFDVSALKGKKITKAYIHLKPAGGARLKLNGGSDLKWLTVSTVSHDWVEGKSKGYGTDAAGNGATFNESSYKKKNWGFPGSKAWDVILGNGNTLRYDSTLSPKDGWLRMEIPVEYVQALVAKSTYGLLIMDGSTTVRTNNYISSREGGNGPFLEVEAEAGDAGKPSAVTGLKVTPADNDAGPKLGALQISFKVPANAFSYNIKLNDQPVARWQIPFAKKAGETQTFSILDLEPGKNADIEIKAVNVQGDESEAAAASGAVSPKLTVPKLPSFDFKPGGGAPKALGTAKIWVFPEVTKVHPVQAKVMLEKGTDNYKQKNPVWDGASGLIRVAAAKGEIISFQVAIEGQISGVKIDVGSLEGPSEISNKGVKLWRNWYVKGHSEYALPWKGSVDCPMADNNINGQTLQAVTVDYHVPIGTQAGDYNGTVKLTAGANTLDLKLKVKVYNVTIPEEVNFNPEFNCYGGPGKAGSPQFKDSFRIAHYHRCTINRVPYSQSGRTHGDWIPKVDSNGNVTDWSNFDNNLGGLLDGSWFKDNPRAGVPVKSLYLPLYDGWPLDYSKHYNPGKGAPFKLGRLKKGDKKAADRHHMAKLKHDILALPIREAFDDQYKKAFVNCSRDFYEHFKEKGWLQTMAQVYLNNKPFWGYSMWTLDEPYEALDWLAINFYGELYKEGINDPDMYDPEFYKELFLKGLSGMKRGKPVFLYRGDVSRPMWQGSISDDNMNIIYVGGKFFSLRRLCMATKHRAPAILYAYGSASKYTLSNWQTAAWCLKSYATGGDGCLPWQSLGKGLNNPDPSGNALIVNAGEYGHAIASMRVHAFRTGAQYCELLRLLQIKKGWSRGHMAVLMSQKVPLTAEFKQRFNDEAAAITFGSMTSQGFVELKEGLLKMIEK